MFIQSFPQPVLLFMEQPQPGGSKAKEYIRQVMCNFGVEGLAW